MYVRTLRTGGHTNEIPVREKIKYIRKLQYFK